MGQTVLLTGGTGFLGRCTREELARAGFEVICGVRDAAKAGPSQAVVQLDLNQPHEIVALKNLCRADAIVHLACLASFNEQRDAPFYIPNVLATGCLTYLSRIWNARMVFSSAAIVHGISAVQIEKSSPIVSDTAYGRSKLLGEDLIRASGIAHCILRIGGIFGPKGPKHLGLNRAIDGAIKGAPPAQIGTGQARRNYIYVKDVAKAIVTALEKHVDGVHLLAGSEILSIDRMLQTICKILVPGSNPTITVGPKALDQIIEPSAELPPTRSFRDAMLDILQIEKTCV